MSYGPKRQNNALYGDGSDGDVSITSGTTTLTSDMFYNSLTISVGAVLKTSVYRTFVKTRLVNNGLIHSNGVDGGGNAGNDSFPEGPIGVSYQIGGNGGNGGAGTMSDGGLATSNTGVPETSGGINIASSYPFCLVGYANLGQSSQFAGGAAGGGGGGSTGADLFVGGTGGGPGGVVIIAAKSLSGSGSIQALGGNGNDSPTVDTGSGGGGGGGALIIITGNDATAVGMTYAVTGGVAGTPNGGTSGDAGSDGNIFYVRNSL